MAATKTVPVVTLDCGCSVEIESHGGKRVVGKCTEAEALFAETKAAGERTHDRTIRGGAKTELVREFDRRRTLYREHIGLGA
jgi:hypothetical protein